MLAHRLQRWPTSDQHWANASCLLGTISFEKICDPSAYNESHVGKIKYGNNGIIGIIGIIG